MWLGYEWAAPLYVFIAGTGTNWNLLWLLSSSLSLKIFIWRLMIYTNQFLGKPSPPPPPALLPNFLLYCNLVLEEESVISLQQNRITQKKKSNPPNSRTFKCSEKLRLVEWIFYRSVYAFVFSVKDSYSNTWHWIQGITLLHNTNNYWLVDMPYHSTDFKLHQNNCEILRSRVGWSCIVHICLGALWFGREEGIQICKVCSESLGIQR